MQNASDHEVRVDYHQFFLSGTGLLDVGARIGGSENRLISEYGEALGIQTGIAMGPVRVSVILHAYVPDAPSGWEISAESKLLARSGVFLVSLEDESIGVASETTGKVSAFHVRVSGSGREVAFDLSVLEAVETYEIALWPIRDTEEIAELERLAEAAKLKPLGVTTGSISRFGTTHELRLGGASKRSQRAGNQDRK